MTSNDEWIAEELLELRAKTKNATQNKAGIVSVGDGLIVENGRVSVAPFYGFQINFGNSSPSGCISYTGQAANMSQAERKAWSYGKVKPTVVDKAKIKYDLKRDNLAKKLDGSNAVLDGTDGQVCASFSPIWWRTTFQGNATIGLTLDVRLSEYQQAGYVTAHVFNGKLRPYLHLGMFEATGDTCDSVYSTELTPAASRSYKTFCAQAATKNEGLAEPLYAPETYLTHMMYCNLFVFAYGTLDSQSAVGKGNVSNSAAIPVGAEALLTANGEYGDKTGGTKHCMALYVCNPWGNVNKFYGNCMWNNGDFALATDQSAAFDIELGWANKPASWHTFTPGIGTAMSGAYITQFSGDAHAPFFPSAASGGDSGSYACDTCYSAAGEKCCFGGGYWHYGAGAGLFRVDVNDALSNANSSLGARLQALDAN